jgi:hypothetical protein
MRDEESTRRLLDLARCELFNSIQSRPHRTSFHAKPRPTAVGDPADIY